ncbi:uncharacterized protein LOC114677438 isoform X2 [Macaca mulatta]
MGKRMTEEHYQPPRESTPGADVGPNIQFIAAEQKPGTAAVPSPVSRRPVTSLPPLAVHGGLELFPTVSMAEMEPAGRLGQAEMDKQLPLSCCGSNIAASGLAKKVTSRLGQCSRGKSPSSATPT